MTETKTLVEQIQEYAKSNTADFTEQGFIKQGAKALAVKFLAEMERCNKQERRTVEHTPGGQRINCVYEFGYERLAQELESHMQQWAKTLIDTEGK